MYLPINTSTLPQPVSVEYKALFAVASGQADSETDYPDFQRLSIHAP